MILPFVWTVPETRFTGIAIISAKSWTPIDKLEECWHLSEEKFRKVREQSAQSRAFASACQEAWNCDSLEEMIRRRDQLQTQLRNR